MHTGSQDEGQVSCLQLCWLSRGPANNIMASVPYKLPHLPEPEGNRVSLLAISMTKVPASEILILC